MAGDLLREAIVQAFSGNRRDRPLVPLRRPAEHVRSFMRLAPLGDDVPEEDSEPPLVILQQHGRSLHEGQPGVLRVYEADRCDVLVELRRVHATSPRLKHISTRPSGPVWTRHVVPSFDGTRPESHSSRRPSQGRSSVVPCQAVMLGNRDPVYAPTESHTEPPTESHTEPPTEP